MALWLIFIGNCSAEVHCCHSSPNLLAIASAANRYSVFTNGIFKVYTIASCENCLGLEFLQSKNVKSWESLLIRLSDNNLTHNVSQNEVMNGIRQNLAVKSDIFVFIDIDKIEKITDFATVSTSSFAQVIFSYKIKYVSKKEVDFVSKLSWKIVGL